MAWSSQSCALAIFLRRSRARRRESHKEMRKSSSPEIAIPTTVPPSWLSVIMRGGMPANNLLRLVTFGNCTTALKTCSTDSADLSERVVDATKSCCSQRFVFSASSPATMFTGHTSIRSPRATSTIPIALFRKWTFCLFEEKVDASFSAALYKPCPNPVAFMTAMVISCRKRNGGLNKYLVFSAGLVMILPSVLRVSSVHCVSS
mmetsp:Transcript_83081/g.144290  ORF Transcript_83081/g.144290 Transcript_83081/m.144290 type:complete len:204 (+) Transcript_83081:525-1136(+)